MLIGARLFGIAGALLAIPFATALMVVIKEVREYRETISSSRQK
jgi:predicted PurR-regulated permease PerM